MSKNTTSTAVPGLSSRRLFLAAGSAAAVLYSLRKVAAAEVSPLPALIETHRAAREAFCDACDIEQEAERTGVGEEEAEALWQETNAADSAAAVALLAYPCRTIEEARTKAAYILASPLQGELHASEFLQPFLQSFVVTPAAV